MDIIQQSTNGQQRASRLAIASLVTSILGISFLPFIGSLCGIITGHMARAEIRRQPDTLKGDELAIVGLILGWLALSFLLIVMAIIFYVGFLGSLAKH
ncbi:DUF4190 domain-containing protein [Xylella fastidiosa subsp. fastidiosa]|jgi:hypothetical protein|nr:DUF4190 domain-containing protein [Xylella fastidiosa]ADN62819.1 hypothetical protein XFLM_04255 [Xylella fastidiosa subsp. fastidiosa GB514]KAF0571060.1 hypothetical protein P305_06785 [Xylella fastidiosa subsp. fastidiosa Mus-1]ACB93455.1 conserved hypothetical protein [Xylella fastidiosa M23]EGO81284.1 hypothetical protein XFEB_01788 [Xylella fastidiosa EB92.1]KGM19723.1 hypothetical protein JT24_10875 [Xylella fastidiosa]